MVLGWDLNGVQDIRALPVLGGLYHPIWSCPTNHKMFLDTRNKNRYGFGVGISTVFEIVGHFLFQGGWDHPYGHDLHTILCPLTQESRICMV
jgi:hypothetical protein